MIRLIVAMDEERGIARDGQQPWKLPADERYFAEQTKRFGGVIIMGHTTYQVIGRALPGRSNYVLTRQPRPVITGITWVHNLSDFLDKQTDVWVIGGAEVYEATIQLADELYVTQIDRHYECDQFFPAISNKFVLTESKSEHYGETMYDYQRFIRAVKNVAPYAS